MSSMAFAFLITVAVGGVLYVFIYPMISGEKRAEQRMKDISADEIRTRRARKSSDPVASRKQQVEDSLRLLEQRMVFHGVHETEEEIGQRHLVADRLPEHGDGERKGAGDLGKQVLAQRHGVSRER